MTSTKQMFFLFTFLVGSFLLSSTSEAGTNRLIKTFRYGHYCGSGHGGGGKTPIDGIDRSCYRHDQCCKPAPKVGGVSVCPCWCDRRLVNDVVRYARTQKRMSKKKKQAIRWIKRIFKAHICHCKGRVCNYKIKCKRRKRCKRILKKKVCVKVPSCKLVKVCGSRSIRGWGAKCRAPICRKKRKCKRFFGKKFCFSYPSCKR